MPAFLARPMLRSPAVRMAARRFESTNASKASEAAKDTANKAQQGLSRVTSAAGPAISGAARGLSSAMSKIGGRTGRLIAFVERKHPHTEDGSHSRRQFDNQRRTAFFFTM